MFKQCQTAFKLDTAEFFGSLLTLGIVLAHLFELQFQWFFYRITKEIFHLDSGNCQLT